MKKRALALILVASLLTVGLCSCGRTGTENDKATKSTENATSAATEETEADIDLSESVTDKDYTTGSPWIASNIESNVDAAGKVDLKDHFDLAVNGDWVKENQIKTGDYENAYIISFEETLKERLSLRIV